jgi:aspartate/methionine/tyrosine aminotransferase
MEKDGTKVVNLGIGSPDLPPHPEVIKVLQHESAKPGAHAYQSYKGSSVLRNAMSAWYKRSYDVSLDPQTEILPLMGSKEGIMHICMTYLNKGDEVLVPNPGYPTYKSAVSLAGGKCRDYDLKEKNNYEPDLVRLEKQGLKKVKLMFINYPHMPTGQLPTMELFSRLVAFANKHEILLVHDNPYSFILNEEPLSILKVAGAKQVAVELNSLSKSHNMAGWRIGMLCGAAERVDEVLRFKSNMDSGMFLPLQLAAAKALQLNGSWEEDLNNIYRERRHKVFELLDAIQCTYLKNQAGMFVWAKIPPAFRDSMELSDIVLKRAYVFLTPGSIFGNAGKKFIRISLCSSEEKIGEAISRIKTASISFK